MTDFISPIATALTAKFAGVSGIRSAARYGTDNLTMLPGVMVFPPDIRLVERSGTHERYSLTFPATVAVERPAQPEAAAATLVTLIAAIYDAWLTGITLGGIVVDSDVVGATWDPESIIAGDTLPVYGLEITVNFRRSITRTA